MQLEMRRATTAVAETEKLVQDLRTEAGRYRQEAAAAKLARDALLQCIMARVGELKNDAALQDGLGTLGTGATTDALTAGGTQTGATQPGPGDATASLGTLGTAATTDAVTAGGPPPQTGVLLTPQPAPGSQPFDTAGLEAQAWPGSWTLTCPDDSKGEGGTKTETGQMEFRFSPGKATLSAKGMGDAAAQQSADIPLDQFGAFAWQDSADGTETVFLGQFQTAIVGGSARPVGRGELRFAMDLSFIAAMMSNALTFGASGGEMPELTPEQKEQMMVRCNGTWQLAGQ
jgi:hypothetical protein